MSLKLCKIPRFDKLPQDFSFWNKNFIDNLSQILVQILFTKMPRKSPFIANETTIVFFCTKAFGKWSVSNLWQLQDTTKSYFGDFNAALHLAHTYPLKTTFYKDNKVSSSQSDYFMHTIEDKATPYKAYIMDMGPLNVSNHTYYFVDEKFFYPGLSAYDFTYLVKFVIHIL